jgi:hypothetical protein
MIMQGGYVTVCCRVYGDYPTFEQITLKALIMTLDLIYKEPTALSQVREAAFSLSHSRRIRSGKLLASD